MGRIKRGALGKFLEELDEFFGDYRLKGTLNVLLGNIGVHASIASGLSGVILYREFILDPGYYPSGGMQNFSNTLANKFKEYGGEIIFSAKVKKILTERKEVRKILIGRNNKEIFSNIVVCNNDVKKTFCELLDIKTKEYNAVKRLKTSPSIFGIYLGIKQKNNNKVKEYPCTWVSNDYNLDIPFTPSAKEFIKGNFFLSMFTCFPISKVRASIEIFTLVSFISKDFWKKASLRLLTEKLTKIAQEEFGLRRCEIEVKELATPLTFEKYTLNTHGVAFGWRSSIDQNKSFRISTKDFY